LLLLACSDFFGTKFWSQGLLLTRQILYHLNHSPTPFTLVAFEIGSCFIPELAWTVIFLFICVARMTDVLPHPSFYWLGYVSLTFCLDWPCTTVLLISTYRMARILISTLPGYHDLHSFCLVLTWSLLYQMNIATPVCFMIPFSWNIIFFLFTFSLCEFLLTAKSWILFFNPFSQSGSFNWRVITTYIIINIIIIILILLTSMNKFLCSS
jgi:hypothetical protein